MTAPVAQGIVDPYTGDEIAVFGVVSGHVVTFSAPEAFSLAEPQADIERLYSRASMRGGLEGAVPREQALTCAYTGRRLSLERLPDGRWCLTGGFNPRRGMPSLVEFVRLASRGARRPSEPPKAELAPRLASETAAKPSADCIGEELSEIAGKAAKALGADRGRTTVSMSGAEKGAGEGERRA